ncbi:hypothetical protein OHV05_24385 [Kitasatospora sp. NBC_00070]|uniref:hypothetical protein n=1 Tax=Kitasatospora sp. NBC_00070 TaxID=2975962 RepID=UPI00324ACC4B
MGSENTIWAVIVTLIGAVTSVLVARISRLPPGVERPVPEEAGPARPRKEDLTTIAGLASEVLRLGAAVADLTKEQEAQRERSRLQDLTIRALRRYILVLETALRRLGADVPEPDPADVPLIRVP